MDSIAEGWTEDVVHHYLTMAMIGSGILTALYLLLSNDVAPYGRFSSQASAGYGFNVPARLAWFLQEFPAFCVPFLHLVSGYYDLTLPNYILVAMFLLHYSNRTFLYPLRLRSPSPTPVVVMLLALFYCLWNGYVQARSLFVYRIHDPSYLYDPRFIIGVILFASGMFINIQSDQILRSLRKPGETGYKVPRGGVFHWISAGNYFGESVEWLGFAIASWSWAGFAFFIFTVSNLGPRAMTIHQNYLRKMDDYPKDRKAFIPYLW